MKERRLRCFTEARLECGTSRNAGRAMHVLPAHELGREGVESHHLHLQIRGRFEETHACVPAFGLVFIC